MGPSKGRTRVLLTNFHFTHPGSVISCPILFLKAIHGADKLFVLHWTGKSESRKRITTIFWYSAFVQHFSFRGSFVKFVSLCIIKDSGTCAPTISDTTSKFCLPSSDGNLLETFSESDIFYVRNRHNAIVKAAHGAIVRP